MGFLQEGAQGIDRDAEGAPGEAVHVGGVDADHFSLHVEHGAAASAMGRGSVVDQLVADDVAEMPASGGRTDKRQGCQLTGRTDVVAAVCEASRKSQLEISPPSGNTHGIADDGHQLSGRTGDS